MTEIEKKRYTAAGGGGGHTGKKKREEERGREGTRGSRPIGAAQVGRQGAERE